MSVQRLHREAFISAFKDEPSLEQEEAILQDLRDQWLPSYREAALEALTELERESIEMAREEMGLPPTSEPPPPSEAVRRQAQRIGKEAYDDAENTFTGQYAIVIDDPEEEIEEISLLAASTMASMIGAAVSLTFNEGRQEVVEELREELGSDVVIMATRTAVMDDGTCTFCEELHDTTYEYDSEEYHTNKPPHKCVWVPNCRCTTTYSTPVDVS